MRSGPCYDRVSADRDAAGGLSRTSLRSPPMSGPRTSCVVRSCLRHICESERIGIQTAERHVARIVPYRLACRTRLGFRSSFWSLSIGSDTTGPAMQSVSIGHVRGIELRVHPTFGIVLVWVIYEFGISGNPSMGSLLFGLVLIGLLFGCVILHELGHSLMAQEYGIRVRNITLFPFGGAAFIEQMPMRPRSEFMITIAGPAVNVAIAATLLPLLFLHGVINNHTFGDFFNYLDDVSL